MTPRGAVSAAVAAEPRPKGRHRLRVPTGIRTYVADARRDRFLVAAMVVGLVARVVYWQVTNRKFEDGLITVTHARNVFDGFGLTHHGHEAVTHGFTSALSVLVPLVGEAVGQVIPQVDGFLALRLASLAAFVATVIVANGICRRLAVGTIPRAFVLLFLAVDYNQIFYGMAGMETQMAIAILLAAILATMDRRVVAAGVLYGLCILVRPDFGLFVAPAVLGWLWRNRGEGLRVMGLAAAVVAPWVIFTTAYYGSPIPNTIKAKALRYHTEWPSTLAPGKWWEFLSAQVAQREIWWHTFTPFWENGFVTDAPLLPFFSAGIAAVLLLLAVAGLAITRRVPGWRPAIAFLALFVLYRMTQLPATYYEWYYPPITALLVIAAAVALTRLGRVGPKTAAGGAIALTGLFAWPFPAMVHIDRVVQRDIENQVRVPLGLWLRDNVPAGGTVTSESAGYVGYYGRGDIKLYDYPGLTSKDAYRVMERLGSRRNNIFEEVNAAKPDFVVWRPGELQTFTEAFPWEAVKYREVKRFAVVVPNEKLTWHGAAYMNVDREFIVVQRIGP